MYKLPENFLKNIDFYISSAVFIKFLRSAKRLLERTAMLQFSHSNRRAEAELTKFWSLLLEAKIFAEAFNENNENNEKTKFIEKLNEVLKN